MKKKFGLWFNIVTICLCVCAIAIGVYAATSATLTVSGQIGFTAHGVDVTVTGYISGHAAGDTPEEMKNGVPVETPVVLTYKNDSNNDVSSETTPLSVSSGKALNIGEKYFSDMNNDPNGKPTDIIITLNFTNSSKYNVMAKVESSTSANTNIQIDSTQTIVMDKQGGVTAMGSITLTLKLQPNAQGEYVSVDPATVSISIKFDKTTYTNAETKQNLTYFIKEFTIEEKDYLRNTTLKQGEVVPPFDTEDKTYMERFPYYVEMGTNPISGQALRWLIVGIDDEDDQLLNLTQADNDALAQGFLLDKDYYLLSEKVLDVDLADDSNYGISFQNNCTVASDYSSQNKYGLDAYDYATSNIRDYLKGKNDVKWGYDSTSNLSPSTYTPKDGTEVDKLVEAYGLTDSSLYGKIKARSLDDLYIDIISNSDTIKEVPTSKTSEVLDTSDDTFWLLSRAEFLTLFGQDVSSMVTDAYLSCGTTLNSNNVSIGLTGGIIPMWCLRTTNIYMIDYVTYGLPVGWDKIVTDIVGVRPACKI